MSSGHLEAKQVPAPDRSLPAESRQGPLDFGDGINRGHPAPSWMIPFFVVIVLVALASGILATNGAIDTVEVKETPTFRDWLGYYSVAAWTIMLTLLAAVAFSTAHFWAE
jgi:hypothetical protein